MTNVFANMWQVAGKSGNNKSIARFPDVCLSPPSPPAGPIPIPYPDTSFSTDLKEGSETVKVGGKPAALAQKSYYKPSALGNEAATRSFGASVVTHQITGKTYFQAWSMDVKFEGKNVCRHIDITTSNHASYPGATPPAPTAEQLSALGRLEKGQCPCCGSESCAAAFGFKPKGQDGTEIKVDTVSGEQAKKEALSFREFYRLDEKIKTKKGLKPEAGVQKRIDTIDRLRCSGGPCVNAGKPHPPISAAPCDVYRVPSEKRSDLVKAEYDDDADLQNKIREAKKVPKTDDLWEVLGKLPDPSVFGPVAKVIEAPAGSKAYASALQKTRQIDHTTPRNAGGCPSSENNTEPAIWKCKNCTDLDKNLDDWADDEVARRRKEAGIT